MPVQEGVHSPEGFLDVNLLYPRDLLLPIGSVFEFESEGGHFRLEVQGFREVVLVLDADNSLTYRTVGDDSLLALKRPIASPEKWIAPVVEGGRVLAAFELLDPSYRIFWPRRFTEISIRFEVPQLGAADDEAIERYKGALDRFLTVYKVVTHDAWVPSVSTLRTNIPLIRVARVGYCADDLRLGQAARLRLNMNVPYSFEVIPIQEYQDQAPRDLLHNKVPQTEVLPGLLQKMLELV
ncbi:MAG: hypothetical protein WCB12_10835 [Bryobacteraceae bacterium]